jgi:hypothetical protein
MIKHSLFYFYNQHVCIAYNLISEFKKHKRPIDYLKTIHIETHIDLEWFTHSIAQIHSRSQTAIVETSNKNADPQGQKDDSAAEEDRCNQGDQQLFEDIARQLGARHLIHEEPGGEENADTHEDTGQMRKYGWVYRRDIPGHVRYVHLE